MKLKGTIKLGEMKLLGIRKSKRRIFVLTNFQISYGRNLVTDNMIGTIFLLTEETFQNKGVTKHFYSR